ncbi:MAG: PIN domain protein [Leptospiraceae bacterium]|nr:PIN domain protein [Leptospiraceae bacterium]
MRIYLDNCCFNRPFDDMSQIRVKLEADAKLYIQEKIRLGVIELIWSYILEYENSLNPYKEKKNQILAWKSLALKTIVENNKVKENSKSFMKLGIKKKDSLHIACAIEGGCKYFLTTDDKILLKASLIKK